MEISQKHKKLSSTSMRYAMVEDLLMAGALVECYWQVRSTRSSSPSILLSVAKVLAGGINNAPRTPLLWLPLLDCRQQHNNTSYYSDLSITFQRPRSCSSIQTKSMTHAVWITQYNFIFLIKTLGIWCYIFIEYFRDESVSINIQRSLRVIEMTAFVLFFVYWRFS